MASGGLRHIVQLTFILLLGLHMLFFLYYMERYPTKTYDTLVNVGIHYKHVSSIHAFEQDAHRNNMRSTETLDRVTDSRQQFNGSRTDLKDERTLQDDKVFHKKQLIPISHDKNMVSSNEKNRSGLNHQHENKSSNIFSHYDIYNPPIFHIKNDRTQYFQDVNNITCFIEGTDLAKMDIIKSDTCICKQKWFGKWCSFPEVFRYTTNLLKEHLPSIQISKTPRKIISATPFNIEFEMVEARFGELWDVVDVFMILEANFTGHGDPRPLRLLNKLRKGDYQRWQDKIVYGYTDKFPKEGYKNGWVADDLPRDYLAREMLLQQVANYNHDDIFMLQDTDELPMKEAVQFLKHHTGYPEPVGFHLWKSTYGYFWRGGDGNWPMFGACSIGFLGHVLGHKGHPLRNPDGHLPGLGINIKAYMDAGGLIHSWKIGKKGHFAGWHCSWCFDVEGIRTKLVSAINADFPRWGDYPEKTKIPYIQKLVKKGMWFDEKSTMKPVKPTFPFFAPKFVLQNRKLYKHLLENPYKSSLF